MNWLIIRTWNGNTVRQVETEEEARAIVDCLNAQIPFSYEMRPASEHVGWEQSRR